MSSCGCEAIRFIPEAPFQLVSALLKLGVTLLEIAGHTQIDERTLRRMRTNPTLRSHASNVAALKRLFHEQMEKRAIQYETDVTPVRRALEQSALTCRGAHLTDAIVAPEVFVNMKIDTPGVDRVSLGEAWFTKAKIHYLKATVVLSPIRDPDMVQRNKELELAAYREAIDVLSGIDAPHARTLLLKANLSLFGRDFDLRRPGSRATDPDVHRQIIERDLMGHVTDLLQEDPANLSAARMGMVMARVTDKPHRVHEFLRLAIRAKKKFENLDEEVLPGCPAVAADLDLAPYLRKHPTVWHDIAFSKILLKDDHDEND